MFKRISRKAISLQRLETFKKEVVTDAHAIPLEELCLRLKTDPVTGLSNETAKELLLKNGYNMLTPPRKTPEYVKFLKKLFYGFSFLLWIGAFLCGISVGITYLTTNVLDKENMVLGIVLVVVVVITGAFTYSQEKSSSSLISSFSNMVPPKANVIRSGQIITILSKEVVIGDLIVIQFGDRVPADIRIIESKGLKVDNSPLTGECEALIRSTECTSDNYLETKNMAFFSTNVVEGLGRGITVATGDATAMGHIAGLTARLKPNQSPLNKEMSRFMVIISCWAICLGIVFGVASLAANYTLLETVLFVIGIIIANVPEGLLACVTLSLTITARKMAVKNCLIKSLDAVETLGSTSVICSDKTGTLTQNRMTVTHVWYSDKVVKSANITQSDIKELDMLLRCAVLCNRAEFLPKQEGFPVDKREVRGDASEAGILKFVERIGVRKIKKDYPKLFEIPFSSATKYQLSIHWTKNNNCLLVLKGAPEVVLDRCSKIYYDKATISMDDNMRTKCENACMNFAKEGERVLGFCDLELDDNFQKNYRFQAEPVNFPVRDLRFVGLISMIDPPRSQVKDAISKCRTAGIRVFMVTGDHPVTAKAIALQVGIIQSKTDIYEISTYKQVERKRLCDAAVIHGNVLRQIISEDLDDIIYTTPEIVFARTTPHQKLQIVESCQRLGEIVAVTGDGVNDAPALKKADIGIAMGITGTDVSKEAADMILLDDNFASIIIGIEEGRRIFDNLRKSITYILASNFPELTPFLIHILFKIPLPLGTIPILCIDLLTDMLPAISLAYEKAETDIMQRPPRNPLRDRLVSRKLYFLSFGHLGLLETIGGFVVYFVLMAENGFYPGQLLGLSDIWSEKNVTIMDSYNIPWNTEDRKVLEYTCSTGFMIAIVISQMFNLNACRTRLNSLLSQGMGNTLANISLILEFLLVILLSYCPYMFYLTFYPLPANIWLFTLPFAIILLLFDEFRKWHIRKYPKGWYQRETYY